MTTDLAYQAVIDYWFDAKVKPLWFNSTKQFDDQLREDLAADYRAAKSGELDHWKDTPLGSLALVILLDQIPLNIFRGNAESFSTEQRALEIAENAIAQEFDKSLTSEQKAFLYMPFMHSENLADQDKSITLFEAAGLTDNLKFARHHRDIISRFGRFPHRNAILGRPNTASETEYLASDDAFLG